MNRPPRPSSAPRPLAAALLAGTLLAGALALSAHAQTSTVRLDARIGVKGQRSAMPIVLTGRYGDVLSARLPDNPRGTIRYNVQEIVFLDVPLPPDALRQAEAAARVGKYADAVRILRPLVRPLVPYLDLPLRRTLDAAFRYADFLRLAQGWSEAISIYQALQANADPDVRQKATGWLAYSLARARRYDDARTALQAYTSDDPAAPGFVPAAIAHAWVDAYGDIPEASLDWASRAVALSRVDHELHSEAMYLSAEAYRRMARPAAAAAAPADGEVVQDGETDLPPRAPAMPPADFLSAASNQYRRIVDFFPQSPFAGRAAEQLQTLGPADPASAPLPGDNP
jgi:hypothetical protein